jgi:hypothetical protein
MRFPKGFENAFGHIYKEDKVVEWDYQPNGVNK